MNIHGFNWDEKNERHIARHEVLPDEVEEAFEEKYVIFPYLGWKMYSTWQKRGWPLFICRI